MKAEHGPVLVGFDGSDDSVRALAWGATEARCARAPLVVVHAWHVPQMVFGHAVAPPDDSEVISRITRQFECAVTDLGLELSTLPTELAVRSGEPVEVLLTEAAGREAAVIVVGSRGRGGLANLVLGSVCEELAGSPHRPLVVTRSARGRGESDATRVVVGTDGSTNGAAAVGWAAAEARRRGWDLEVVMAWEPPEALADETAAPELESLARDALEAQLAEIGGVSGDLPHGLLIRGHPAGVLLEQGATAALLVVGTRGLSAIGRRRLGSTSRAVLRSARVPVAIVPDITDVAPPPAG